MTIRTAAIRIATLGALTAALGLGACVNYDAQFAGINGRLDQVNGRLDTVDMRVQEAIQRADAAGQAANTAAAEAARANQRVDQLQMQHVPPRAPRG